MQKYFQFHYKGASFHLFSKEHILALAIIGLLGVCLFVFRRFLQQPHWEKFVRYLLAFLLIVSEISLQSWYIYFHEWSPRYSLPLELSDLTVLLSIVMLLTRSAGLFKYIYFAGLGSSLQAILTPDLSVYSFPHFRYIEFFVSHGGVFLACLFMIAVEKFKPTFRSLWETVLALNIYGACIFIVNRLVNANYLYIMKKPNLPTVLDVLGPWPWYLIPMEAIIIIAFLILYAPFYIYEKIRERSAFS
ncbi:putative integral membrane protein (TIGR02206 family) [Scopulibacillus daqui]|uniref:Integral membrane protein (TIGR02206 family) n=1 Tax=Scopulibacillus daqui TaxID=1469162 RepID=A0ABS2Q0C7_9BACL|nr:TIGR02206 family membrane protein [Scopulibacillus daqui]MBM7644977.1 putative integral membrane protein (TIGR02206 family) [Scopulibacillus daqui]